MTSQTESVIQKGPWVLVVDDDPDFVEMVSERLRDNGYRVLSCGKSHEAVRMINNQKFSCIIVDYRLEVGDGGQVIHSFRKKTTSINYSTPVLLMSGQFDADFLQKVGRMVSGAVVKPFDMKDFVDKVSKLSAAEEAADSVKKRAA
jgi:DNA-binding response OmpR family regulator